MNYYELQQAIDADSALKLQKTKLGPTDSDSSSRQAHPAAPTSTGVVEGADEEQSSGGAGESAMAAGNTIEEAMMAGLEKEFEPRGDLPAIQEILEVKDLLNHVQNLKQVYT